ncbi:hypothetical protein RUM44_005963 [Polyplax serrata]|uniref:Uncharacterized protein n=1 Tax=Polyplax serrata TaxID=468196 RepID=A0ABR1B0G1_POLSC
MDATRCLDDFDPDFKYTNANVSHSWLMNYPDRLKPRPETLKISSKNETYAEPKPYRPPNKGKRKKMMEAFFRQVMTEEVLAQFDDEQIYVEPYNTDYSANYKNPDDMALPGECLSKNEKFKMQDKACPHELSKVKKLEELKSKYPLYLSAPLTFVSQMTGKQNFRKNSTITKPPDRNYDNIEY